MRSSNVPYCVEISFRFFSSRMDSLRVRYRTMSEMLHRLMSCSLQNRSKSSSLAIVPSSFMTSQMAAIGFNPASLSRSTEPSVCPRRTNTPSSRAMSGNTCPGRLRSSGWLWSSASTRTVFARSGAEIPVVMPSRASTDTVNPGSAIRSRFSGIMRRSFNASARSSVMGTHMRPRACFAMKLTSSAVICSAAMTRSPSSSRVGSSCSRTILPCRRSSSTGSSDWVLFMIALPPGSLKQMTRHDPSPPWVHSWWTRCR